MNFHLNLEVILVGLTVFSGLILLLYSFQRKAVDKDEREPLLLDYSRSFFPILLIVIVVRSFVAEPFRIPSGSMIPTLEIGDFVLVKKYAYGVKLPINHKKILETGSPKRGDVVVFRYPPNPKINYIKRLIGIPGDIVEWTEDKQLKLNGVLLNYKNLESYPTPNDSGDLVSVTQREEVLPSADNPHKVIVFPGYTRSGKWIVPKGQFFVMGDNRDNSSDSRFWGFVPEKNLVGKASLIWMHWDWFDGGDGFKPSRIGTFIQ